MEAVNPASKSSLPVIADPVIAALVAQLKQENASYKQSLSIYEMKVQKLEQELRLERIRKYGTHSEKLSDLQLKLLDLEPGVSSVEVEAESLREPLPETTTCKEPSSKQKRARQQHPGRKEFPAHLERVDEIVPCSAEQCTCGKCGGERKIIGYDKAEVLARKPVEYFVRVIKREKRACAGCSQLGVSIAASPVRIAPKSIFSDEMIIDFPVGKYCDSLPVYRQCATLKRDLGIEIARTTINDGVLRVGELLIPIIAEMKRDLLAGNYVQTDETPIGVQTPDKRGETHRAYFWQYSTPGKGVVFDFEMTRRKKVAQTFFKDYGGILHTDGYAAYEKDIGTKEMIHACCWAHGRRGFIEALKVQQKANATSREFHPTNKDLSVGTPELERVVALLDGLFAIDRDAREQNLSLEGRHALRQERAPEILAELHLLLQAMKVSDLILPQSVEGKAIAYTLKRWTELTVFMQHPEVELSTNLAENSMRTIALGRRNWLHLGSKEAGPKIPAIFSIVESCRKLDVPIRKYLAEVLPGLTDSKIQSLTELTPAAYAAKQAA
jgi:transposase